MSVRSKNELRRRRHWRVRSKVSGTAERPRMSVFFSNRRIYVQFIDDDAACTLASASTLSAEMNVAKVTKETAGQLGRLAAKKATEKGIARVVFDRGGFKYGACIKALADAAREAGLKF